MDQPAFSALEFQGKKRKTRREVFLERMDGLIPWQKLEERIRPFYPKAGNGRRPFWWGCILPGCRIPLAGPSSVSATARRCKSRRPRLIRGRNNGAWDSKCNCLGQRIKVLYAAP